MDTDENHATEKSAVYDILKSKTLESNMSLYFLTERALDSLMWLDYSACGCAARACWPLVVITYTGWDG